MSAGVTTTETYKGRKLKVKVERKEMRLTLWINGVMLGEHYNGTAPEIVESQMRSLRGWIDGADERRKTEPDAYPEHFYFGAEDAA